MCARRHILGLIMKLIPAPNGWQCPDDPGEPGLGVPRWSVNADEARIVSELCRGLGVLEIGTGLGVSTREIAKLAKHVHTVDIDEWVRDNVELPENVTFWSSTKEIPTGLGAAFIDGLHTRQQCRLDIIEAKRIVRPGGLIIFHDAKMKAVREAIIDQKVECYLIHTPCGLAMGWND